MSAATNPSAVWRRDAPPFEQRPGRQFVWLCGERFHSGVRWRRDVWGIAHIRPDDAEDGWLGYRAEDIRRLEEEGDMDPGTAEVFGWLPATTPAYFDMDIRDAISVNSASAMSAGTAATTKIGAGLQPASATAKPGRPMTVEQLARDGAE